VGCRTPLGSPKTEAPVGGDLLALSRFKAIWCLFGVYFYKVLESAGETKETMETPRKKKKEKRKLRLLLDLQDLL
jgi:hypothetical protein